MSEDEELAPEDRALLAALAALAPGSGAPSSPSALAPASPPASVAEAETLTRLYHETLGLVPFALPPATPSPEVKRRLMAFLLGEEAGVAARRGTRTEAGETLAAGGARGGGAVQERAGGGPSLRSAPPIPSTRSRSASAASSSHPWRWPLGLAAALILALLAACGWLVRGMREQGEVIARLSGERNVALRHAGEMEARLGRLNSRVSSLRDSLAVVTSPAAEVCTLRAVTPELAAARGILFVAADHQHWTLSLRGLRPPGDGRVYQLWFVADQGTVSGGTFGTRPAAPMELGSEHMPAGTHGVRITLENGPGALAPSGPDVLRNADSLHTL